MMKEDYIKKVKRELSVSHKQKQEIIRDLNEAFDSAGEHGETEKQVIDRLGTPKDFANKVQETSRFKQVQDRKRRKRLIVLCCSCGIAIFCFIAGLIAKNSALSDNVIGSADAMTDITVKSFFPFPAFTALWIIGFLFAIVAIILIVGLIRKKR